jgi:hypothetical protein
MTGHVIFRRKQEPIERTLTKRRMPLRRWEDENSKHHQRKGGV